MPHSASPLHVVPTIDVQFLSGDVIAICRQEAGRLRDLLGRGEPSQGNLGLDLRSNLFGDGVNHLR